MFKRGSKNLKKLLKSKNKRRKEEGGVKKETFSDKQNRQSENREYIFFGVKMLFFLVYLLPYLLPVK